MSADSWLEVFRGDPARAVADLFSGRAGAGSDLRLDIPEFLHRELERIGEISPDEREDLACTVMAGKAADVPEFTPQPPDWTL